MPNLPGMVALIDIYFLIGFGEEKVAFSVHLLGDKVVSLSAGSIVTYDQVLLNLGNGYNKNSGSFTAPVAGTYFFTIYTQCQKSGKETTTHVQTMNHTIFYYNNRENC